MKNIQSDLFVAHYSNIVLKNKKPSRQELQALMGFRVLHNLDPISAMKTIGTDQCELCTDEKIQILKSTGVVKTQIRTSSINAWKYTVLADTKQGFIGFPQTMVLMTLET